MKTKYNFQANRVIYWLLQCIAIMKLQRWIPSIWKPFVYRRFPRRYNLPLPTKSFHWWTLCHFSLSAADEMNYISGSHIRLLGISKAAEVRAVCPLLPSFRASDKTTRSKEMNPVQTWVTFASFPKSKSKEIPSNSLWNKSMVGERESAGRGRSHVLTSLPRLQN